MSERISRTDIQSPIARQLIDALNAEMFELYPEEGLEEYLQIEPGEVAPGRGVFLVAYAEEEPVACGAIRLIDSQTAEVKKMYVAPNMRRRGVGTEILLALEQAARELGATNIVLETGARQPEALAFYARCGFSKIGRFGQYDDHPLNVFMGRVL